MLNKCFTRAGFLFLVVLFSYASCKAGKEQAPGKSDVNKGVEAGKTESTEEQQTPAEVKEEKKAAEDVRVKDNKDVAFKLPIYELRYDSFMPDNELYISNGRVKSIKVVLTKYEDGKEIENEPTTTLFNENGDIIESRSYSDGMWFVTYYQYDEFNRLVRMTTKMEGEVLKDYDIEIKYALNADNNPTAYQYLAGSDTLLREEIQEWDPEHNKLTYKRKKAVAKEYEKNIYIFDDENRLIQRDQYFAGDKTGDKYLYEYDEDGRMIKYIETETDVDKIFLTKDFQYNEDGLIGKVVDNCIHQSYNKICYFKNHDSEGNWTEEKIERVESKSTIRREIEYYE